MKRLAVLLALGAMTWGGSARADQYLLEIPLDFLFSPGRAPGYVTVECYLGEKDLRRLRSEKLGERSGSSWQHGVRGVTFQTVKLPRSAGRLTVNLAYACAGSCLRRYYSCVVGTEGFHPYFSGTSRLRVDGMLGSGATSRGGLQICEGMVSDLKLSPNGRPCSSNCQCNNTRFTGRCDAGRCISLPRLSCDAPGQIQVCVDPFTHRLGRQICGPRYLADRWGDCELP